WKMLAASTKGVVPMLVLLGNTFDFWQSRRKHEKPEQTLARLLEVHVEFTVALREWIGAGGEISLVIGPRDQALVQPNAWGLLREVFPTINVRAKGHWTHHFEEESAGIYAEHGGRWHPCQRLRLGDRWPTRCTAQILMSELGERLEPRFPWFDKLTTLAELLRWLDVVLEDRQRRNYAELLARLLRGTSLIAQIVAPWLEEKPAQWERLEKRENAALQLAGERLLIPRHRLSDSPLKPGILIHSMTRTAGVLSSPEPDAPRILSPGTWCPTVMGDPHAAKVLQRLPYVECHPDQKGSATAELKEYLGERAKGANFP
ncbi:MAG: hypothetical protein SFY68_06715, partial [Candidatus Sumerlaeia bacterium]|nr:hypothetical protein [Candidatus Sumerlaeia bacterium]